MVVMVRALYQRCRLVHADLSEYNVLVHNDELYCIDVSQAVELDHPRAFDFLKEGETAPWAAVMRHVGACWGCARRGEGCVQGTCLCRSCGGCTGALWSSARLYPRRGTPAHSPAVSPRAADCLHVNDYFRRQGVATLTVRELFDFVVDPGVTDATLDAELDRLMALASRCARPPLAPASAAVAASCALAHLRIV